MYIFMYILTKDKNLIKFVSSFLIKILCSTTVVLYAHGYMYNGNTHRQYV